jgi:hypothetical protein
LFGIFRKTAKHQPFSFITNFFLLTAPQSQSLQISQPRSNECDSTFSHLQLQGSEKTLRPKITSDGSRQFLHIFLHLQLFEMFPLQQGHSRIFFKKTTRPSAFFPQSEQAKRKTPSESSYTSKCAKQHAL